MAEIAGLTLITPSSVAGSGVSLSGAKVVFTAATSVSVNGVFDSTYDNYLVVFIGTVTASSYSINYRLRLSGSDVSGSNYTRQDITADGASVSGSRSSSQTESRFGEVATGLNSGFHAYFYGPALAQPTATRSVTAGSISSARIKDYASTHSLSTAYDGFSVYPNANSITGSLTIYGLSQ